jgi:hypothetical protein
MRSRRGGKALICPTSQALSQKYFTFVFRNFMIIVTPSRLGKRGVRVVTNVGRDAMDVVVSRDERHEHGRRNRVVLAPLGWR